MAEFNIDIRSTSPLTWTEGFRDSERGKLKSVSLSLPNGDVEQGQIYCIIGAMSGGRTEPCIKAVFFEGYISGVQKGGWNGDYPLESSDVLFVRAKSTIAVTIRFAGRIDVKDP